MNSTTHKKKQSHKSNDDLSARNAKRKSDDLQDDLIDYINEKPLKSLSIAVLSGIIIGYLLHK